MEQGDCDNKDCDNIVSDNDYYIVDIIHLIFPNSVLKVPCKPEKNGFVIVIVILLLLPYVLRMMGTGRARTKTPNRVATPPITCV